MNDVYKFCSETTETIVFLNKINMIDRKENQVCVYFENGTMLNQQCDTVELAKANLETIFNYLNRRISHV